MAWTAPATWTVEELVTAAKLNAQLRDNLLFIMSMDGASNGDSRTFTNTSFLDLDGLTGGSGTVAAVSVSVVTGTRAIVAMSASNLENSGGITIVSYRVSGATTVASSDLQSLRNRSTTGSGGTFLRMQTALTPGTNVFELQARVNAGTGTITGPNLIVIPLS